MRPPDLLPLPVAALLLGAAADGSAQMAQDFYGSDREEAVHTYGMAEIGVGLLNLPGAEVCVDRAGAGCSRGDTSLAVDAWPMFRRGPLALGAGVMLGLTPTTEPPRNDPPDLPRKHSRSYFTLELTGRYYLALSERLDGWAGVTTGIVIVNDTLRSRRGLTEQALVGPRGATILTEGYTVGLATGLSYLFSESWLIGGSLRVGSWFLPREPARDPIGDEASLTGRITTFNFGVNLAYRSRFIL